MSSPRGSRGMPILPIEAYTSQEWFDREQRAIFSNTWRFAGLAEDLTEPGQYLTVQAGLNNIFLVMGRDRRLRAFHNICRHRGTQLLRATGKTQKAITCPYHDWTYDLEGALIAVPEKEREFPDLDPACTGLLKASVDRWRGMLFVHPDPEAGSIMEWFGELEPYLGPHRPDELVEVEEGYSVHEIQANWKIVVENFIDAYHLAHLHSGTLAMYDHSKIQSGFVGPHFAFYEPLAPCYAEELEKKSALPLIDHVPREKVGAYVPLLFPCLGLAETESTWSTFHIVPLSPVSCRVESRTKVADVSSWEFQKQSWRSAGFWSRQIRAKVDGDAEIDPMASADFVQEDIYACEQQQKSLRSPYFAVGATARRGEAAVRELQALVGQWVEGWG
ncbi:MAG: aromatic ring-hydroxylating dioxygenase subunit alpha [Holophagales bacterium]|nr:aromatic ring-hydroxylating dioxygenase subunit alpha [Holophagales bacterium]